MKQFFTALMLLFLINSITRADELVIRHISPQGSQDQRSLYVIDLLHLALKKTAETDGPYRLEKINRKMFQGRAIKQLAAGRLVDVVWTMTSKEREELLLPIRIPLLKGLLGHRIFIIRAEDKEKFSMISTLDDLKKLTAGQGHDWPDSEILRANGIKVISSPTYKGLFSMLEMERFDYFPRGINEPWAEVDAHKDKQFVVEESLLIQYPAPQYFFVNKHNTQLALRLEKGLRLAIKDGSFDRLFYHHPANREIFESANIEHRKIFRFKNPLLPVETPLQEKSLWYTPQFEK
ncbi:transporter substrate-binding domain-containing protein [Psychromonas ossibalaenae]|uniref:transporter substrate-binding domain-containing protein n=1 Tax=Psychromonas ossibalaenae TaxID=444922 RepID=UPI000369189B|nr:transporter substrate-binding domain-containing protein [Psychromonas ossibalaenae]